MVTSVIFLASLALFLSFAIAVAAKIFAFETDSRIEQVEKALPGANCGACGFPGCSGLAKAIVEGKTAISSCPVGGETVGKAVAKIMGVAFEGGAERMVALVHCQGGDQVAGKRFFYNGVYDCISAAMIFGGDKDCSYGCLGLGTCAGICPFEAMRMLGSGLAVVDREKCTGCGKCISACPKGIIKMVPYSRRVHILCSSHDKGATARKVCKVACIACQKCIKAAPEGAITMSDFLAVVNYAAEIPDSVADECPMNTIAVTGREECCALGEAASAAGGDT